MGWLTTVEGKFTVTTQELKSIVVFNTEVPFILSATYDNDKQAEEGHELIVKSLKEVWQC